MRRMTRPASRGQAARAVIVGSGMTFRNWYQYLSAIYGVPSHHLLDRHLARTIPHLSRPHRTAIGQGYPIGTGQGDPTQYSGPARCRAEKP